MKGNNVIIYFYPRGNTPGCTQKCLDFQNNLTKFKRHSTTILGVSHNNIQLHENFRNRQGYKSDLLSDPDEILCKLFDVIKMKNMYCKKVSGIERSTFLIDQKGKLQQQWRKVKVKPHVEQVLNTVKTLNKKQK